MSTKRKRPTPMWPDIRKYVAGQMINERSRYEMRMRLEDERDALKKDIEALGRLIHALAVDVHQLGESGSGVPAVE
jgi:hypothetical protein